MADETKLMTAIRSDGLDGAAKLAAIRSSGAVQA